LKKCSKVGASPNVQIPPNAGRHTIGGSLMDDLQDRLLFALDGRYRELRQDNHVTPNEILVFTEETGIVESVDLMDLPLKYPCGPSESWSLEDLGAVVRDKASLYRRSLVAHEISDEDPEAEPTCGTVVLIITTNYRPYQRLTILSRILPDEDQ